MTEQDFNEHKTPNGGWQFRQPEFGNWTIKSPIANTLSQSVQEVIAARKLNKAITAKFKLATNPEAVKSEVLRFNRKRLGLSEASSPVPFWESHNPFALGAAGAVVDSVSGLKRAAMGSAIPIDWLRSGGMPVDRALANQRAATCMECTKHEKGEWYTVAAGELIKKTIEMRSDIKLETDYDDQLQSCGVCSCLLRAKVHCPLDIIVTKTKPEIMAELPPNCWIIKRDSV